MQQVLFAGIGTNLDTGAVRYSGISGGYVWSTSTTGMRQAISTPGYLDYLRIELSGAPDTGKSYTFVLLVNGAPTALTCTIADLNTSGSDLVNSVAVSPGDTVQLRCTPAGSPDAAAARWTMRFTGDNSRESLILGTSECLNAANSWSPISQNLNLMSFTENDARQVCPTRGKIKNLYCVMAASPGGGAKAYTFTLRVNGINSALTCTIAGAATTANDTTHEVTVAAGDILTLGIVPVNSPDDLVYLAFGTTFLADIDGESLVLGGGSDNLNPAATEYKPLVTNSLGLSWNASESFLYQLGQACTLRKLYVLLSAAPDTGKSYTFMVRQASAPTALAVTIADLATTGNNVADDVALIVGNEVAMQAAPTASPDVADAYWGCVCYILPTGGNMQQVLFAGHPDNLPNRATGYEYNALQGGDDWSTAEAERTQLISADGTLSNLRVKLVVDPAPGTYHFVVLLNGAPSALAVSFTGGATEASDIDSIGVTAGDRVCIRVVADPGDDEASWGHARWSVIYTPDTAKQSQILGLSISETAGDYWHPLMGSIRTNAWLSWGDVSGVVPTAGKIKRLFVEVENDPGDPPEGYRYTLLVDGVASALTCTITANNTTANDVVNEVTVAAGDRVCLYIERVNAPTVQTTTWFGLTFEADTDGESILLGTSIDNLPTVATEFNACITGNYGSAWLAGESVYDQLAQATYLYNLYIELSGTPGGTDYYTFQVRKNGGASLLEVTIPGGATTGNDVVNNVSLANFDTVDLRVVPTDTPTARDAYWGMVSGPSPPSAGGAGSDGGISGAARLLV